MNIFLDLQKCYWVPYMRESIQILENVYIFYFDKIVYGVWEEKMKTKIYVWNASVTDL